MATDVAVDVSPVKICEWRAHACDCERLRLATSLKPQSAKVFSPNTRRTRLAMPIDYSKRDRLAASSDECSGDGSRSSPEGQELESDAVGACPRPEDKNGKNSFGPCLAAPLPRQSQGHRVGPRRSSCRSTRQPSHAVRRDLPVFSLPA